MGSWDKAGTGATAGIGTTVDTSTSCLIAQEERLRQLRQDLVSLVELQEGVLRTVREQLAALTSQLTQLHPALSSAKDAPLPAPIITACSVPVMLSWPEKFSAESRNCQPFLMQCKMHFELQVQQFSTERAKISHAEQRHGLQQSGKCSL